MADLARLETALAAADKAGDADAARALATEIRTQRGSTPRGTLPDTGQDTSSKAAFLASGKPPEKGAEGIDLPAGLRDIVGGGEAALSAASGAAGAVIGPAAGVASRLTGSSMPEAEKTAAKVSGAMTYEPRSKQGRELIGKVGEIADATKIAGLNPAVGMEANALKAPAVNAARRGAGVAGEAVSDAAGKAKLAVTPKVAPDRANLAVRAQELGIQLRPDMLSDHTLGRMIGEALEKVPLSGSKAEQRQQAFNQAVMKTIGAESKEGKLTPDVFEKAFNGAGKTIGDISERTPVPLDPAFAADLSKHLSNMSKETTDVKNIVSSYVKDLHDAAENGVINGTQFRKINSQIGEQVRGTTDGDLRRALGNLQDDMQEALSRQLSGADKAALQDARKKYAIGIKLIPLVAKSETGDIRPASLMQAVTADKSGKRAMALGRGGDLGELAKIGQVFLKEPKSSGTAERNLAYGLIGDAGRVARDAVIWPVANAYNRLGPKLSRKITGVDDKAVEKAGLAPSP